MKQYRFNLTAFLAVFAILTILAACQPTTTPVSIQPSATQAPRTEPTGASTHMPATQAPPDNSPPSTGGTIVVALSEAPVSLDPADHRSRPSETVIRNMFDGLVTRDTRSGVHMQLAESMTWSDDRTLDIKLRQGVKFHDGSQMTADDIVFTFERIIKDNQIDYPEVHSSPRKGLIAPLESIEKTGDYSVVMHFNAPWPPAMQLLVHQQIVPKAYIERVGTKGFIEKPIGTGPFKFVSAKEGLEEIVMERFDDYYGGSPDLAPVGTACVDRVIFRVIPEASTRAAALLAGEVQIIQSVPSDLVSRLKQNDNVAVKTAPGTQPKWIELNVNKPPFDDVRVRQAMNYVIDKNLIIQEIYDGRAVALPGPLSPFNNYVNKSLKPYPYDLQKAQALLKEAGWEDTNNDGILDKDGQPLSFTIDTLEEHRALAEAVANLFQEAGIDAGVRFWEYSVVRPMLLAGERQAYLDDWGDSAFDPVGHFEAKWHGYVEGQPYGRGNFSGYNNERVNELIVQGETTVDPAKRQAIYDEAQQLVYDESPAVFLILPEEIEASLMTVMNWEPASDSRINLHDVCLNQ
jgi:peptide/nickel transport system substrate-binding protein